MKEKHLNVMFIGAHPDDPDGQFGGTAMLYRRQGHRVMMLSMTNGNCGHHVMGRKELAARRRREALAAGRVMGAEYKILPVNDGELLPSLANRRKLLRIIREFRPDIIFTHSPGEYHPDHRYTTQLVLDTSYMVVVPNALPDTPALKVNPCYFFAAVSPRPGVANVCIPIDTVWERKLLAWHQHASQMYEWLPWVDGVLDSVPSDEKGRLKFLGSWRGKRHMLVADNYRAWLKKRYGQLSENMRYAEAAYAAPVGRQAGMKQEDIETLFPLPAGG